jgi:tetratricopeptide (TPR) repeat protein
MHDAAEAAEHYRAAARAHAARGNLADAIAAAGESIALAPHHAGTVRLRAELLEKTGRTAEAAEDVAVLLDMARREENIEDELERLAWFVRLRPDDITSVERLANMYSDLDMASEAAHHFTAVARAREAAGQRDAALDAASSAATLNPDSLAARIVLARLLLATGQERRAREEALWVADRLERDGDRTAARAFLADLCAQWTDPLVALRLAGIERADGDTAAAAARYRAVLGRRGIVLPEAAQLEALEGLLAIEPGDIEAQRQFQQLAAAHGATARIAPLALAAVRHLAEAGEVEAARRFAEETEPRTEDPVRFLRECAGIYDQAGIPELAAGVYRSIARRLLPTNPRQALRDVNHCLELRPNDLTARELRLSILDAIGAGEEMLRASSELVALYTQRGDESRALELTRQMIRANPASIEARERFLALLPPDGTMTERLRMLDELASLYIQAGEPEAALDKLRELLRIDPYNREARLRYIDIYRQVGPETELAGDYLRLARAHEKAGDTMAAANTYERLITLAPAMEEAHREFIRFLREQGQGARLFAEVITFAESLLRRDENREAVAVLQQIAAEGELDPTWHLLLGRAQLGTNARGAGARSLRTAAQLYRQARLHAEEAAALRELIRVDTYNLEARQQLIEALLSSGQLKEALAASEQLAHTYAERGLFDLAVQEYRRLLAHERYQPAIWQQLFDAHLQIGREIDLVPDYLDFADLLATRGDFPAAVGYYRRVIALDPANIRALRGLVIQYPKIGAERDIIDEILQLGSLLIDAGEVDEAARYFQLVMAIDPRNTRAREMMSATRGATGTANATPSPASGTGTRTAGAVPSSFLRGEDRLSETQKRFIYEKAHGASPVAAAGSSSSVAPFSATSPEAALTQAVANYRNILLVNSANPAVRLKLADVLEQMGRRQEMLEELGTAAEQFFRKGEVAACIAACNRYIDIQPNDARIRRLLSEAEIKRDAIKALDSTISHLDFDSGEPRRQSKGKT